MPIFLIDFLTAIAESFIRVPLVRWLVTDRPSSASSSSLLAQTLCPGSSLTEVTRDRYKVNEVRQKNPIFNFAGICYLGGRFGTPIDSTRLS
jgi:hypothetical protein